MYDQAWNQAIKFFFSVATFHGLSTVTGIGVFRRICFMTHIPLLISSFYTAICFASLFHLVTSSYYSISKSGKQIFTEWWDSMDFYVAGNKVECAIESLQKVFMEAVEYLPGEDLNA